MNESCIKDEPDTKKEEAILKQSILAQSKEDSEITETLPEGAVITASYEENAAATSLPAIKMEPSEKPSVEEMAKNLQVTHDNDIEIDGETDEEDELYSEYEDSDTEQQAFVRGRGRKADTRQSSTSTEISPQHLRTKSINSSQYNEVTDVTNNKRKPKKQKTREVKAQTIYRCDRCGKTYHYKKGYQTHMSKVHEQAMPATVSARRSKRFESKATKIIANNTSTSSAIVNPYDRCQLCAQPFFNRLDYSEHMEQVHQVAPDLFRSAINADNTSSNSNNDVTDASNSAILFCDNCQQSFTTMNEYTTHLEVEHSIVTSSRAPKTKTRTDKSLSRKRNSTVTSYNDYKFEKSIPEIQCRFCLTTGYNSTTYREHLQAAHMSNLLPMVNTLLTNANLFHNILPSCEECDVTLYDNLQDCLAHFRQVHKIEYVLGQGFVYRKDDLIESLRNGASTSKIHS
ncbi:hypothetical protein BDF20DRAFT_933051 [Mycotypha africana]|uniref:uncharacterized protein n=1 Tax=Mycotypha africana TaxID=64632 RepID=UPI0022FFC7C2|nr:uncharacterized protein BDF20DRAFT_933051 [Mycotypha africana]KAI8967010.1 hypothetical protein BDF20DRAFT_933051 [Mycotypha africana]